MQYSGNLRKLVNKLEDPVAYYLVLENSGEEKEEVHLNPYIGKDVTLTFENQINCVACDRLIKKSYQQGYCFPCTQKLAQCDMCILKPETCHYDKGTCREPDWGLSHCFQPHIVYLANTSGLKVGITRETQVPTRWIDQGASFALPVFRVQSRYQSGLVEIELAKHMADKTNWRKMLQGVVTEIDLEQKRNEYIGEISEAIQAISGKFDFGDIEILTNEKVVTINYPVMEYPTKIASHNFDKNPEVSGKLMGIKGQYLIFDTGVINIRKFSGYRVTLG